MHDDLAVLHPARVSGIPESLVQALVEWVEGPAIPQELADLTGLSADRVQEMLRQPGTR